MKIVAKVATVKFFNEENGYTIMLLKHNKNYIDATGLTIGVEVGEELELEGEFVYHKKYGNQFNFKTCSKVMPKSKLDLIDYIAGNVKGVGKKTARNIVNKYEDETVNVIKQGSEDLLQIKGLTMEKIECLQEHFNTEWEKWNAFSYLSTFGITVSVANKIYEILRQETIDIIKKNPYSLLEFVKSLDFNMVDEIGMKTGIDINNVDRLKYGILYTLNDITDFGHTCVEEWLLISHSKSILNTQEADIINALIALSLDDKIYTEEINGVRFVFRKAFYQAEANIAKFIHTSKSKGKDKDYSKKIDEVSEKHSLVLSKEQIEAINTCLNNQFTIISRRSWYW